MESLLSVGIDEIDWLRLGWLADREALLHAVGDGPINRWGDPIIEFSAYRAPPDSFSGIASLKNIERLLDANALAIERTPSGFAPHDPDTQQAHRLTQRAYAEFAWRGPRKARALLHRARILAPDDPIVAHALKQIRGRPAHVSPARR
jgi:hypothetical protein